MPSKSGSNVGGEGISRRDFINGMLLAAGGIAVLGSLPMKKFDHSTTGVNVCDGGIVNDPRAIRAGDLKQTFIVGHWLRDNRLTFNANSVSLADGCGGVEGTFPINADNGSYDVIIVGSGMSGLSAAFFLSRRRPGTRILILDGSPVFGGNAARDDLPPIPVIASAAGAYAAAPYNDDLTEIYKESGIDWSAHYVPEPFYSYYFDDYTPHVLPCTRSWTLDVYGKGADKMPYPDKICRDLMAAKEHFISLANSQGSPTDPADSGDPRYDYLAHKTLHEYLTGEKGYHPAVSDFYSQFAVDALAGPSRNVNAYTSIAFIGAEYNPIFTLPGGTSGIARHILNYLIPNAIDGSTTSELITNQIDMTELDKKSNLVRIRQNSMVLHVDTKFSEASVIYHRSGQFFRAHAKAVILAGQGHTGHRVVDHLMDNETRSAWHSFTFAPVIVANVVLKSAAPLFDLGLGYNNYWWGSKHWADFVIADWVTERRFQRNRETVLTVYGGNYFPPEEMAKERVKLLQTSFGEYEESLRQDLNRILAGGNFDFNRDVSAVYIYRWGHGMIYPKVGFPFGKPKEEHGQIVRTKAARHIAREQIGRISFAAQDTESSPAIESAIGAGVRACKEVLPLL